ncbi:hypothetical protein [Catalinimonas niigatensis]|uniref:hypothetical protein n=1 Tax=Catalinimonas niigatensis TaxID=1397264 RepID=UPI0026667DCF|nr:hypothetical protein [Catalinimonas niigatensis]WPP49783.1 hypothetical protein PZB72_24230 [Catalinimonas niigatensis]
MKLTFKKKPVLSWQDRLLHGNTRKVVLQYALPLLAVAGITFFLERYTEKIIKAD